MSINLKDANVIKCLSYNAHSSIGGSVEKFGEKYVTGLAKVAKKLDEYSKNDNKKDSKWEDNILSYSEGKADLNEVYSGWSGFKICESPSLPDYRFIFFQEAQEKYDKEIRLICVEKGKERQFVLGIIFSGSRYCDKDYKNYKDINKGKFTFEIDRKEITNIEKISGNSFIRANAEKESAIMFFAIPDTFVSCLLKNPSSICFRYKGEETYPVYLVTDDEDHNRWQTRYELEKEGLHPIINYEEWRKSKVEPIYRESQKWHNIDEHFIIEYIPQGWKSLYNDIKNGKIAEYVKSVDAFKEKFPLLAKYGFTKKKSIIFLVALIFSIMVFINEAMLGHDMPAFFLILVLLIGSVYAWLHRPKK